MMKLIFVAIIAMVLAKTVTNVNTVTLQNVWIIVGLGEMAAMQDLNHVSCCILYYAETP